MTNRGLFQKAGRIFHERFGRPPAVAAYAPGRVEVLGNHTDYNEGYVLSAAIDLGTFFLAAPAAGLNGRVLAGDILETATMDVSAPARSATHPWANYVIGVLAGLAPHGSIRTGFDGMFLGNVPLGTGLSSSAALEMCAGLALSALYRIEVGPLALAKIGQSAEHRFAGVNCGLLDQISSLYGKAGHLVMSDFRSLAVDNVPLGAEACFLMCNTRVKRALVDGEYNERRARCEEAARHFAAVLEHPVAALRDVTWAEWLRHSPGMAPVAARRAAHVIGEDERVLKGRELLARGQLADFGQLMFESHESSIRNFENSCDELDFLVSEAKGMRPVLGARLSGGGFGGSAVLLLHPADAQPVSMELGRRYEEKFGRACDIRVIAPSDGATRLPPESFPDPVTP